MNIKINKQHLDEETISKVISFLFIHILVVTASVFLVSIETKDLLKTLTSVLSCISNVGKYFSKLPIWRSRTRTYLCRFKRVF